MPQEKKFSISIFSTRARELRARGDKRPWKELISQAAKEYRAGKLK